MLFRAAMLQILRFTQNDKILSFCHPDQREDLQPKSTQKGTSLLIVISCCMLQILRFTQNDKILSFCHPDQREGSAAESTEKGTP